MAAGPSVVVLSCVGYFFRQRVADFQKNIQFARAGFDLGCDLFGLLGRFFDAVHHLDQQEDHPGDDQEVDQCHDEIAIGKYRAVFAF